MQRRTLLSALAAAGATTAAPWAAAQSAWPPEFDTKRRKLLICLKRLPEFATTAM